AGAVARHAGGDRREMERPSLRSRPAESGDPLSTVGPEGPAHRIQAGRLRNVRRPDARRTRDLRRALAQASDRDRAAAPARGTLRPGWPAPREPGVGSRSRAGQRALTPSPHAHGREQAGRRWPRASRSDRRRERLWSVGPAALTGQELLAILLGTGCSGRDALAVAAEVLARVDGSLRRLAGRPSAELTQVPGMGRTKAARVAAALELGRRVGTETEPPPERVRGPADVQRFYRTRLRDLAVEDFHVLAF